MRNTRFNKTTAFLCGALLTVIAGSFYLHFKNNEKISVVFEGGSTYYLPGTDKKCSWVANIKFDITNEDGSYSPIYIGLPDANQAGVLKGGIEIANSLAILAFNYTSVNGNTFPYVLTSDISGNTKNIKHIRFKWFKSTVMTMNMFLKKKDCVAYLKKQDS
jgi:hypothetical protein